ncbi:MAG: glycosyltransferase [Thermodesulfobacteriota bacterium]
MRIAYLIHWNEGEKSGVFKKIIAQVQTWRFLGSSVSIHVVARKFLLDDWQRHMEGIPISFHLHKMMSRFRAWRNAVEAVKAQKPDIVYHRYDLYVPPIQNLGRIFPLILEINTDDLNEYCIKRGIRCWYNRLTRRFLLQSAAGIVAVTNELASLPHFKRYQKNFAVIANGIDLKNYHPFPPPNNVKPRLVFIGSEGQPWQGVDKVIRMAQYFPEWHFDIIGITPEKISEISPNISILGPIDRRAYEPLMAKADIGVGSLALHRKRMNEGSSLKVREYLAYGLPIIIGNKDTDFLQGAPFILELPNKEDNVESSVGAIEVFVSKWKGQRVERDTIDHIDIKVKEAKRLAFFKELLEVRR